MKNIAIFAFICLLATNICYAQTTVILKSGKTIEGKLIEETDDYIKIDLYGIELTYWMDEIKEIVQDNASAPSLSAPIDQEIIIKGTVILDDYKQGYIRLAAFDRAFDSPERAARVIATVEIPMPGPYTLVLPPNTQKVFLRGYNDIYNDGPPFQKGRDISFSYGEPREPLVITDALIEGIDLIVETGKAQ